jgi:hypothetical protein
MIDKYKTIKIDINGTKHTATYILQNGMVTVKYAQKQKTTQIGGSDPEVLVRLLLSEIIKEKTH